jgi:type IV secretory pathway TrbD component
MALAAKPIPRVLWRHHLLMGGEREAVLISAIACAGLALTAMNLVAFIVCGVLWAAVQTMWVWLAHVDPQMIAVYRRHIKYERYYPPFSRPYRDR